MNLKNMEIALAAKSAPAPVQAEPMEEHAIKGLNRVRKQIKLLNIELEKVLADPDSSNKYSAALERLYRIEQGLSMRPNPGNLKPTSAKAKSRPDIVPLSPSPDQV